ncbi:hypothetical protein [Gymnodinialimonas ulvae]|uniref:hypothetical protein n=1 Tax=Gymnodinialimonas ulvae TaxID=3126504 RepID=UPI0030B4C71A
MTTAAQNIWYLRVLGEMHSRYGFTADMLEQMTVDQRNEVWREYARRDDVDTSVLPDTFWVDPPMAGARGKTLKAAHVAAVFLTVSREFLDVLEQFDLGLFKSWPVTLLKRDKTTPFEGEWHAIWVGTRKDGFLRDKSHNFKVPPYERTKHLAIPRPEAVDGDFVFDVSVAAGPDLWRDQNFSQSLLLSDRLHTALKEAGLLKKLVVLRCPLVG